MKLGGYLRRKFCVPVVVDYTEPQISNFVIEYLCNDEKVRKTVLAYLSGVRNSVLLAATFWAVPAPEVQFRLQL